MNRPYTENTLLNSIEAMDERNNWMGLYFLTKNGTMMSKDSEQGAEKYLVENVA